MRLLVCGGRFFDNKTALWGALDVLHAGKAITMIVHGACPVRHGGADMLADAWAWEHDVSCYVVPINQWLDGPWPGCGRARNIRMWARYRELIQGGVAFPGGSGTKHMVALMEADGIEVWKPMG